jgi:hypothetical protein
MEGVPSATIIIDDHQGTRVEAIVNLTNVTYPSLNNQDLADRFLLPAAITALNAFQEKVKSGKTKSIDAQRAG